MRHPAPTRSGTVLLLVAGISALLASLALTFLVHQRASSEESSAFERDIQARIMLIAGCNYIQETSRIGYDVKVDPTDPTMVQTAPWHREAFGWIDVRLLDDHGLPLAGPNCRGAMPSDVIKLYNTDLAEYSGRDPSLATPDRPVWPAIGGVARCPMYVMERPPFAIQLTAAYNPVVADPTSTLFGKPYQSNPDPLPVVADPGDYMTGKPNPRPNSVDRAWFRVYRQGAATFIITCGSGGTQGFSSWNEVLGADKYWRTNIASAQFGGDPVLFASLLDAETRLWYRVEWSAAVAASEVHNIKNAWLMDQDHYMSFPMDTSQSFRSQPHAKNMGGTFRYVQRLRVAPTQF